MRRTLVAVTATLMLAFASIGTATGAPIPGYPGGNCPGYDGPTKVDTSDGSIILPEGTVFCIHASNTNTGYLVADGVTTLAGYIEATILNGGGQVPNVSNYVTYGQPTSPPTTPSAPPETPEPSLTPTLEPSPVSVASRPPTGDPSVTPTMPDTSTGSETPAANPIAALLVGMIFGSAVILLGMASGRKR